MAGIRMVHLRTVSSAFEGKVLAARLGSEGIVTQLRGAVDGPYPFGEVFVDVDAELADLARQLLLADEVEVVFEPAPSGRRGRSTPMWLWLAAGAIVLVALASSVVRVASL